jgi:hypothetical protein
LLWMVFLAALLAPQMSRAQGVAYHDIAWTTISPMDTRVKIIPGATITVCSSGGTGIPCSPTALIYSDVGLSVPLANPFTADSSGNFAFFAAAAQYVFTVTATGVNGYSTKITLSGTVTVGTHVQVFPSNGTFTIPTGVTLVKVTVVGGGGAGGGGTITANNAGQGGGSAAATVKWLSGLTPGNTLAVTIGAGGTGVSAANGNPGGVSSVASGTQIITTLSANGGTGGQTFNLGPGSGGAAGVNGDLNLGGNTGGFFNANNGGAGAGSIFAGGAIITPAGTNGAAGMSPGAGGSGGGSGSGNSTGGAGANGVVIFEWVAP